MKTIIAAVCVVLLAGCASYAGRGLEPGRSSAEEVEALMGPSAERRSAPNGESVRYYSRLPFGRQTYAARFDRNGRLIAVEQRLTTENAAKLQPGKSTAPEVRDLLGPPWREDAYPRLAREIWTYPMMASDPTPKHFYVQFSGDGVVRELYLLDDPDWRARDSFE